MSRFKRVGPRLVLFGLVAVVVVGFAVSWLWNVLMPAIFHLPAINFWQALGMFLLSRFLFGSFGRHGHVRRFGRGWSELTPDERRRFRCAMEPRRPENSHEGGAAEQA